MPLVGRIANYHRLMNPNVLRGLVVFAVLAILVVSAIPLLILLDLAGDGTGWGLCDEGLDSCRVGPLVELDWRRCS